MFDNGSTGNIMLQIADAARAKNHIVRTFSTIPYSKHTKGKKKTIFGHTYFGNRIENFLHYLLGTLLGRNGYFSYFSTKRLVRDLHAFSPDILHLHNLHKFCINIRIFICIFTVNIQIFRMGLYNIVINHYNKRTLFFLLLYTHPIDIVYSKEYNTTIKRTLWGAQF